MHRESRPDQLSGEQRAGAGQSTGQDKQECLTTFVKTARSAVTVRLMIALPTM